MSNAITVSGGSFGVPSRFTADIASGALPPDARIPTENDMHTEWGVARTTARRAVAELRRRELIYTVAQRGSFVAAPSCQ